MFLTEKELSIIASHVPARRSEQSLLRAAVAIILRDGENGTEFLMMQRAIHEDDPWSGQMSFPGGKIDPQDESARHAAERETLEEVGVKLSESDYVGRLDDLYGLKVNNHFSVHVACFIYKPTDQIELRANYEVADMVWVSMQYLNQPENALDFYHPKDQSVKMPAVLINSAKDQVLWGLSLRMISMLYSLVGFELEVLSEQDQLALEQIEKRNLQLDQQGSRVARFFAER